LRLAMIQDKNRRFPRDSGDLAVHENVSDEVAKHHDAFVLETLDNGSKAVHLYCSLENGIHRSHQIVHDQIRLLPA
jgi:hypothetical protein